MIRPRRVPAIIAALDRRAPALVVVIVAALLLSGTLYSFQLGETARYKDEEEYSSLAQHIARSLDFTFDGARPVGERPPGYPILLAPLAKLGGDVTTFRVFNFVLLAIAAVVAYRCVARLASPAAGVLTALLIAFYPLAFYTAGTLFPQTLATCLFVITVALLLHDNLSPGRVLGAGLAIAVLVLAIPNFVVQLMLLTAFVLWRSRRLGAAALFVAPALLLCGLWTVRNLQHFDQPFFISANSGVNLLYGNSANTTPNNGMNADIDQYRPTGDYMSPEELDAYYRDEAIHYIRTHKLQSAKMYVLKAINYFNFRNELHVRSEMGTARDLLMAATYLPLLLFALARIAMFPKFRLSRAEVLLYGLYFANAFAAAVFFTRIRFRVPFDALLIIAVVLALDAIRRQAFADRQVRLPAQPTLAGSFFSTHHDAEAVPADAPRRR